MSFWDFADKHVIFVGVIILFIIFAVDSMWGNYCKWKIKKNKTTSHKDGEI